MRPGGRNSPHDPLYAPAQDGFCPATDVHRGPHRPAQSVLGPRPARNPLGGARSSRVWPSTAIRMSSCCSITSTVFHCCDWRCASTANGGSPLASDPGRRRYTSRPELSCTMAKSVTKKLAASIIIEAFSCNTPVDSSRIWANPDVRASSSQAGVPGVRALFISPNCKDPSASRVTDWYRSRWAPLERSSTR